MNHFFAVILFLSIIVTTFNRGFFSFQSLFCLSALLFSLIFLYLKQDILNNTKQKSVKIIFLVTYLLFIYFSNGIYQKELISSVLIDFLPQIFLLPVLYWVLIPEQKIINTRMFPVFIILAITLRILIIIASPNPAIDIFVLLKEAPIKLLNGVNPYDTVYTRVYAGNITDNYTYLPFSIFLELPFILIFKDPRVLLIIADVISAIMIYHSGNKSRSSIYLSLIFLFRPNSLFMIEQSFLTPVYTLFTFIFIYSLLKFKSLLTGISLAVLAGIQPIYLIFIPLTFFLWKNKNKAIFTFSITFLMTIMPFFIWNPEKFIDKNILFYFKPVEELQTIPIHISLNLNTVFYTFSGKDFPFYLTFFILSAGMGILYYNGRLNPQKSGKEKIIYQYLLIIIFFYLFYLLFRQSFIYYYYYTGSLLIFWVNLQNKLIEDD